jgi:hypothetical protein
MSSADGRVNGHVPRAIVEHLLTGDSPQLNEQVTPWGWSANRLWVLSFALCVAVAAVDALLGHRLVLIGLLIVGPCCAVLTSRWSRTALTGAWAVGLAVVLGLPDRIWGTAAHLAFLVAVLTVAVVSTVATAIVERVITGRHESN